MICQTQKALSVDDIIDETLAHEGGYSNDPDDLGGETSHGITLKLLKHTKIDIDGNGQINGEDIRLLTRKQARDIYKRVFFYGKKINLLSPAWQAPVFDMCVNAGANGIKILQKYLNRSGYGDRLKVDGLMGKRTAANANRALQNLGLKAVDDYGVSRRNYYYSLGDNSESQRKYCVRRDGGKGGWIVRAEFFMTENARYSLAQHKARTATWRIKR